MFEADIPCSSVGIFSMISPLMSSSRRPALSGESASASNSSTVYRCSATAIGLLLTIFTASIVAVFNSIPIQFQFTTIPLRQRRTRFVGRLEKGKQVGFRRGRRADGFVGQQ